MPCVFCNEPTSDGVLIDFEAEWGGGAAPLAPPLHARRRMPIEEEGDGEFRPVCVRPNWSERPRYGVLPGNSVSDLVRTKIDLDRIPDPVFCGTHYDVLRWPVARDGPP